jgi:hypothetical protein
MGDAGEAEAHLRGALALLAEVGAVLEAARTRLALASLLAVGKRARGAGMKRTGWWLRRVRTLQSAAQTWICHEPVRYRNL